MTQTLTRRGALAGLAGLGAGVAVALAAQPAAAAAPMPAAPDDLDDLDLPLDYDLADAQRLADRLHARLKASLTPGQHRLVEALVNAEIAANYVEMSAARDQLIEVTARHFGPLGASVREVAYHTLGTDNGRSVWCGLGDSAETMAEVRATLAEVGLVPGPTFDVSPCVVRATGGAA